jgi:hypothetical protein
MQVYFVTYSLFELELTFFVFLSSTNAPGKSITYLKKNGKPTSEGSK